MTTNQPNVRAPYAPPVRQNSAVPQRRVTVHKAPASKRAADAVGYALETIGEVRALMKSSAAPVVRTRTVAAKVKRPVPVKAIVLTLLCSIAALLMIINFVAFNEVSMSVSKTNRAISEAESRKKMLDFEIERKNNVQIIDDYAKNNLGLVSSDKVRVVYLDGGETDRVERYDASNGEQSFFGELLSAIGDNFREYWNVFTGRR